MKELVAVIVRDGGSRPCPTAGGAAASAAAGACDKSANKIDCALGAIN
jgi:hypothetical protein